VYSHCDKCIFCHTVLVVYSALSVNYPTWNFSQCWRLCKENSSTHSFPRSLLMIIAHLAWGLALAWPTKSYKNGERVQEVKLQRWPDRLGLTSLADRRPRGDLIEVYKVVTGKQRISVNFSQTRYNLRDHNYQLATKWSHLEVWRIFF